MQAGYSNIVGGTQILPAVIKSFIAHFHQWKQTWIRIQIPNPIITLYYAQLFPLVRIQIWIPVWIVSQMVTVPILGADLHPRDPNPTLFFAGGNEPLNFLYSEVVDTLKRLPCTARAPTSHLVNLSLPNIWYLYFPCTATYFFHFLSHS